MGHARGAAAVRLAKMEPEPEVAVAQVQPLSVVFLLQRLSVLLLLLPLRMTSKSRLVRQVACLRLLGQIVR